MSNSIITSKVAETVSPQLCLEGKSKLAMTALAAHVEDALCLEENDVSFRSSLSHFSTIDEQAPLGKYKGEECIGLHLRAWIRKSELPPPTNDKIKLDRITEILNYFINIAKRRHLEGFSATTILEDCLKAAEPKDGSTFQLEKLDNDLRTQIKLEAVKVFIGTENKFQRLTFQDLPLHNIFDAIALIYSLCIDHVKTERDGELYLVQLRLILNCIRASGFIRSTLLPNTVAASWQKLDSGELRISFAFAATRGKKGKFRDVQVASRQSYCERLYSIRKYGFAVAENKNSAGNCPEFITWGTVCRDAGIYKTLCLNTNTEVAMACCNACEETAEGAKTIKIKIEDLFAKNTLVVSGKTPYTTKSEYQVCDLKRVRDIADEGRSSKRRTGEKS